jgi:hypothetical protein
MFLYMGGNYPNWAALPAVFGRELKHVVLGWRNAGIRGVALAHLVKDGSVELLS